MENSSANILKKSSDFLEIKKSGQRFWPSKWLLINFRKNTSGQMRFGTTASRKVGSAIVRNKLKRWVREYFRSLIDAGTNLEVDINIIFKPMESNFYKGLSYSEFKKSMDKSIAILSKSI